MRKIIGWLLVSTPATLPPLVMALSGRLDKVVLWLLSLLVAAILLAVVAAGIYLVNNP